MVECTVCLLTDDIVDIKDGICEFCRTHDHLEASHTPEELEKIVKRIKKRKGFQAIIGISGGLDSSYLLHWAIQQGIKVLVIHFDNHWNNQIANDNMRNLIYTYPVTFIRYSIPNREYEKLNDAFIWAGVPEADIPNDMAMTAIIMEIADRYNIKYVLNGHDFRTEGSTPLKWTYMDAKYIQSVYKWYTKNDIEHFPLLTFAKQIRYALKGIKQIRPYYYMWITDEQKKKALEGYWEGYGPKHAENKYTEWVGYKYLPENFGIDKRRVYLSAQIRSGLITKEQAKKRLEQTHEPLMKFNEFKGIHRTREDFETYNFKKYKWLLWLLAKLNLIPYLFYKKYTK